MEEKVILDLLISRLSNIAVSKKDSDFILSLPFSDYAGDPIELSVFVQGNEVVIDDLGRIAGMLFDLRQEAEDSAAFNLVRSLTETYDIQMNFENGLIRSFVKVPEDLDKFVDFIKVITSLQVTVPELKQR